MQHYGPHALVWRVKSMSPRQVIGCVLVAVLVTQLLVLIRPSSAASIAAHSAEVKEKQVLTPVDPRDPSSITSEVKERLKGTYGNIQMSFELNKGQTDTEVQFLSRGKGYTSFLTGHGATMVFSKLTEPISARMSGRSRGKQLAHHSQKQIDSVLEMRLVGSNPKPKSVGLEELPGKVNYFIGNDQKNWHKDLPTYAKVKYEAIYPGIDLVYYGNQRQMEHDFIVAAGANVSAINIDFKGATGVAISSSGELVLKMRGGELRQSKPNIYQEIKGQKIDIAGGYTLTGRNRVGFKISNYDSNEPLVIDPVLTYSTFLGGSDGDEAYDIAVDTSGNAFVIGVTHSTNFPTLNPVQGTHSGTTEADVFVTKLNQTGTGLVYSTYLGGDNEDFGSSIALDSAGNAYLTGATSSTNFPTVSPLQPSRVGSQDIFVAKLNATGNSLVYSTYLGGNHTTTFDFENEYSYRIAVDASGSAYVGGLTNSPTFPVVNAYRSAITSGVTCHLDPNVPCEDGFVTKLNPAGSALVYSTYLGGDETDQVVDLAVNASGNVYVIGLTYSSNFPTTAGVFQPVKNAGEDTFVTEFSADGSQLVFSTYLAGSGDDDPVSIRLDASNFIYVDGLTNSTDFPTVNPFMSALAGNFDLFVTKMAANGTSLIYSTYLGGSGVEKAGFLDVSDCGEAYIVGATFSTNFPTTTGALSSSLSGASDAFVAKLNRSGNALAYSTYLSGNQEEHAFALTLDNSENAYIAGRTNSTNFPVTAGAYRTSLAGNFDGFVTKLSLQDFGADSKPVAPDATLGTGPNTPASVDYHPGADSNNFNPTATVDPTVLPDRPTEIWAKYYWPQGLSAGPYPLVVFLHGNHNTCGYSSNPRIDDDNQYTTQAKCDKKHITFFVTGGTLGTARNNFSGWVGMKITTGSQAVIVRSLGRMFVTGNTGNHALKIVRVSDNATITPSVSVSMLGGSAGSFNYVSLPSPVTLAASTSYYVVSQETSGGDSWYDSNTVLNTTTVATLNGQVMSRNNGWNTTGMVAGHAYGPVSFGYEDGSYSVAPSHRGYDYLAEKLASWGYIVVSVNSNLGINAGQGYVFNPGIPDFPDDPNLIYARGRLVLRHLQLLSEWNSGTTPTPAALGVNFTGKIDLTNIGLMGHSRGGEAMRAAYNLYRDAGSPWPARITSSTAGSFKAIFEIAPVDKQTERVLNADGTTWNVLLPACDNDISTLQGVRPFDRMMLNAIAESPAKQKSTFMVWGANHNFYNTQWQLSDASTCTGNGNLPLFLTPTITGTGYGSAQQQQTALSSVIAFFRANVGTTVDTTLNRNFDTRYASPASLRSITTIERGFTPSPDPNVTTLFEDFNQAVGTNSNGTPNLASNITINQLTVRNHIYSTGSPYFDIAPVPSAAQTLKAGAITWSAPSVNSYFQSNWTNPGSGVDVNSYNTLDFRISRQENAATPTQPHSLNSSSSTNLSIQLVMADGSLSDAVCLTTYADVRGPAGGASELHPIMQTVRIPLEDFVGANLSQVRGVRIVFNKTPTGAIYVANIRFARN